MTTQESMIVLADGITRRRRSPRRLASADAAVALAMSDFDHAGKLSLTVRATGVGSYRGADVVAVDVGNQEFILFAPSSAGFVARVVHLLQRIAIRREDTWPMVPGHGALRPAVRAGRAVWVAADGTEICEVGRIFTQRLTANSGTSAEAGGTRAPSTALRRGRRMPDASPEAGER